MTDLAKWSNTYAVGLKGDALWKSPLDWPAAGVNLVNIFSAKEKNSKITKTSGWVYNA